MDSGLVRHYFCIGVFVPVCAVVASRYWPAAHIWHVPLDVPDWLTMNLPAAHSIQSPHGSATYVVVGWNLPTGHVSQPPGAVVDEASLKFPGSHVVHGRHSASPSLGAYEPTAQLAHALSEDWPVILFEVPASHLVHPVRPVASW